jgi:DNA-binding NarL/FixJ family response regulator
VKESRTRAVVTFSDSFVIRAGLAALSAWPPLEWRAEVDTPGALDEAVRREGAGLVLAAPGPAVAEKAFPVLGALRERCRVLVLLPNYASYQILARILHRHHGLISLPLEATRAQLRSTLEFLLAASAARGIGHNPAMPDAERVLTPREAQVLRELATGSSNQVIAERLVLSNDTVKTHLRHVYRKLGVTSRGEAIAVYMGGY